MPLTCVIDTNVLISAAMRPDSIPARAVAHVLESGRMVSDEATWAEFREVLFRPRLARYLSPATCKGILAWLEPRRELVSVSAGLRASRDADDDRMLALAVAADADVLLTGENDLLVLDPFRGIRILKPGDYLALCAPNP